MKKYFATLPLRVLYNLVVLGCAGPLLIAQQNAVPSQSGEVPSYTLTTTVNRVVLDVVVTDAHGNPVHGLTRDDFKLAEDGAPQRVLSFDTANFDGGMTYTPAALPPLPENTFVDLPPSPERGPLYVILYDLVNIPTDDQVFARKQLVRFIQNAPEGARFAIFVSSDGVHLVQGFTSNRKELFAVIDPKSSRPHVPEIFLMGVNFGQNDPLAAASRLSSIAGYLANLPGRKNLIWMASMFPLDLFPSITDTEQNKEAAKKALDMLAANQIAVYPVDVSGVVLTEVYAPPETAGSGGISTDSRDYGMTKPRVTPPRGSVPTTAPVGASVNGGAGYSLTNASYRQQDEIARVTGGKAIYSSNDVTQSLDKVTQDGGSYYTLTYSPTNKNYNGKLRQIRVELEAKDDHLAYRRAYYGVDPTAAANGGKVTAEERIGTSGDGFAGSMEHGAPAAHQLIFAAHVRTLGPPAMGTPEQMSSLASQTSFLKAERHGGSGKPPKAVPLQVLAVDYTVMAHQFEVAGETAPDVEIAVALYDSDGQVLDASVSKMPDGKTGQNSAPRNAYRMEQRVAAPLNARFLRMAVRDVKTNKTGAMEISLPLAAESEVTVKH